jgi:REP element-mobilizing transposase RayT
MPDHLHFVFYPIRPEILSTFLNKLKRRSSREIHKRSKVKGTLWERRFFDRIIRNEEGFAKAIDYIHRNPVEAELVEKPEDYPFSSAFPKWETDLRKYLATESTL